MDTPGRRALITALTLVLMSVADSPQSGSPASPEARLGWQLVAHLEQVLNFGRYRPLERVGGFHAGSDIGSAIGAALGRPVGLGLRTGAYLAAE